MSRLPAGLVLLLVNALLLMSAAISTQPRPVVEQPAVSGYVLAPDGMPVPGGTVVAQSGFASTTASIDRTGRFRVIPIRSGLHEFKVSVPGLAPYRITVIVPASQSLRLPVIRLAPGVYFRVRLVSSAGEPIIAPRLRRQMFDASGRPIFDWLAPPIQDSIAFDGDAVTIGPLARGIMSLAVDMPGFAQTRLPDVSFAEANKMVDGGIVTIQQPGAVLHVDVVDAIGAPVPNHEVIIDDARPRSPLMFSPARTNQQGRATFDRLAAGRYRVLSRAPKRCADMFLATSRLVSLSGSGSVEMPLVVGGRLTLRITSPLGALRGVPISAAPTVPPPPLPFPSSRVSSIGCRGGTDSDGRITFTNFPPGPAHVDIQMTNSTFVRQLDVLADGREMAVAIPEGLLPLHVVNAVTNQPIAGATVTWTGSGARVEATVTASGDALLEGVGSAGGTLATAARGFKPVEEQLTEAPALSHTVALTPLPSAQNLRARVITTSGEPLPDAVVTLIAANPAEVPRVTVTNANGVVTFSDAPPGSLQLAARADGFVALPMPIGDDRGSEAVFKLARGYRAIASVELPAAAGPQMVRVMNHANASIDDVLDTESDRRLEPPGRLSLGPLPPGAYLIELHGAGGVRKERIQIVDRDVSVTFR